MTAKEKLQKKSPKPSIAPPVGRSYPKLIFTFSLLTSIVIFTLSYFKKDGFKNIRKIDESIRIERATIDRVKKENQLLKEKIKTARTNSFQIEKFAREKLKLSKEGELIFRFKDERDEKF